MRIIQLELWLHVLSEAELCQHHHFLPPVAQLLRGVTSWRSIAPWALLAVSEMALEMSLPRQSPVSKSNTSTFSLTFFKLTEFFPLYDILRVSRTAALLVRLCSSLLRLTSFTFALFSVLGIKMIIFNSPASFPIFNVMSSAKSNISSFSGITSFRSLSFSEVLLQIETFLPLTSKHCCQWWMDGTGSL